MIQSRWHGEEVSICMVSSMAETLKEMEGWEPELVILDYDDANINRVEFLNHFVSGSKPLQVILVSLQASGAVVVFDRKSFTPAQAEDWLTLGPDKKKHNPHAPHQKRGGLKA